MEGWFLLPWPIGHCIQGYRATRKWNPVIQFDLITYLAIPGELAIIARTRWNPTRALVLIIFARNRGHFLRTEFKRNRMCQSTLELTHRYHDMFFCTCSKRCKSLPRLSTWYWSSLIGIMIFSLHLFEKLQKPSEIQYVEHRYRHKKTSTQQGKKWRTMWYWNFHAFLQNFILGQLCEKQRWR